MTSIFSAKSLLLIGTLSAGGMVFISNLSAKELPVKASQAQAQVNPETLHFTAVDKLHAYNIQAFEQVRDKFGFARVIQVYQNPMHQQNLIVGKEKRVKSISLVSNALSKSLNANTLDLEKLPKTLDISTRSHPSYKVTFASLQNQDKIYSKLSADKPMIKDGSKVWAAMFAKQQCLKCHETYKLGSVIGAFVYDLEISEPVQQEQPVKDAKPELIKEVTLKLPPMSHEFRL